MKTKFPILPLTGTARCLTASAVALFIAHSTQAANDYWIAVPGVSADTNWSDGANWTSPNGGGSTSYNQVEFTGIGASANNNFAVNNVVDQIGGYVVLPIWELDYIPTNGNYTTLIDPGVTVTLGAGQGHLMVGADILTPGAPATSGAVETITITGPGAALQVGGSLNVGQGSSTDADGHNVTLDLSGLDTYEQGGGLGGNGNANWLYVAGSNTVYSSTGPIRANGTLYLAKTNEIILNQDLQICNQSYSNSLPCAVYLGQANSIEIGGSLIVAGAGTSTQGAWMKFNPAFLGGATAPVASITAGGGGRINNFWICNGTGGPQIPGYGLCDFSGGNISMQVNSMQLGSAGNANAQGVLTLDNGTVNANNAVIGNQEVSGGGAGIGVVNLNSNAVYGSTGTLIVNDTLTLGEVTGTATAGTAGTIDISGGALSANTIVNGGGTAVINVTNGLFTVTGQAGTASAPLGTLSFAGSTITLPENPSSANISVSTLATGGKTNIINISVAPPSAHYPVQFALIKYSGGIGGAGFNFGVGTLPALTTGYISNNAANSSIDLVLTSGPSAETWTGSVNNNWDTTTANWLAGGSAATYANGAFVQFLDGANSGTVNLTTSLIPGGLTVSNNAQNFTFNGSGSLAGSYALIKEGTGTLVMDNSGGNSFSGGVDITNGVLQVGNNDGNGTLPAGGITDNGTLVFDQSGQTVNNNTISGSGVLAYAGGGTLNLAGGNTFTGPVVVTNSSTLQIGGSSALGSGSSSSVIVASGSTLDIDGNASTRPLVVSGTGVGGNGVLTDSGGAVYGLTTSVTLAGDSTFSYPNRWDFDASSPGGVVLSTGGNPYNLTLNGSTYFQWQNVSVDPALANINLEGGEFGIVGSTTFGNPTGVLTIGPSAALVFYGGSANFMNKGVDFQSGGYIDNNGGNNIMTGAMTLETGYADFEINSGSLTVSNVLSGSGVFYVQGGTGPVAIDGNSPAFTGSVLLYDGQVTLNGLIGSGVTTEANTTLTGSGTAEGLVDISGGFLPGNANSGATFNAAGGLTLEGGAGLTNGLAPTLSGSSDLTAVTGNLTVNGNTIYINPFSGGLQSGAVYPIITYSGTLTGSFAGAQTLLPTAYSFTVTNITSTTPKQIAVIVSGSAANLTWNNGSGNGQWDVLSSANWTDTVHQVEEQFNNGDNVILNDSITSAASPLTTVTVPSGVTVLPALITASNSAVSYTLQGLGTIGDGASLIKIGTNTLNIDMTNTYSGNTTIAAGTVEITGQFSAASSPIGSSAGSVIISNGATLMINLTGGYSPGDSGFGPKPIIVSGAGANGQGAIQNVGNALYDDSSTLGLGYNVTLAGNTTIGGTSRLDWGYPGYGMTLSSGGSNYNLTVIENQYFRWTDFAIDTNLGNIDIVDSSSSGYTWELDGMGGSLGNPTNILTVHSNVTMNIVHGSEGYPAAYDSGYAKVIHMLPTATFLDNISGGSGDYRDSTSFVLENGSHFYYYNNTGGNNTGTAFSGPVTLNGLVEFHVGNSLLTFSNVISGSGGIYVDLYGGNPPLVFAAANTYMGITDLRTNMNLALIGNGSISDSTPISLSPGATLAVTNRVDGTLTLTSGQTFEGRGTVAGVLVAGSGSVLLPGITSTTTNVGLLTVSGNATLGGSALFKLNNTTNDVLSVGGTLTYGGILTLTNISATPLAGGQTFKLFNAASYSGAFASISPATPGAGMTWNTNNLKVNGTISIVSTAPPRITSIAVHGTTLTIVATNAPANAQYVLMESTNVTKPLPWTPVFTNNFNSLGALNLSTNVINPNIPYEYYILQVQ
ncbi:MAG TPA: autotransporter-associated beta strand repeat-containing protein [Alphaproteobacteria bacterium]|nr:autotransporter-associated beta strand repeat-containing protein [Alphaproteobacteria bacterium]